MQTNVRLILLLLGILAALALVSLMSMGSSAFFASLLGVVSIAAMVLASVYLREQQRRRRAEVSESLYRDSFERSYVGIAHEDEEGRWIRVNPRFAEILGCSPEVLIGRSFREFTHPDDLERSLAQTRDVWNGNVPSSTTQKRYIRRDGRTVWVFLSATLATPVPGQPRCMILSIKDITPWKEAETALMESTVQLRLATETAQLGIWEHDATTGRTQGNGRFWKLLGLPAPGDIEDKVDLLSMIASLAPGARANVEEFIQRALLRSAALRQGAGPGSESPFTRVDGCTIWLETSGRAILNDKGEPTRYIGITRDITDRKLAQLDFQRSVDVSPAILWITERDGECTYLSQRWYEFTGQTPGEALGYGWLNAVHEDDRQRARQIFIEANSKRGPLYVEYRLRTAEGAYRWVIDAGNPRCDADGVFFGYAGTIFDIHDKKDAQARVEATAQQFKALANSIPQIAWMADAEGQASWYNERWFEFTGYHPGTTQAESHQALHPDHAARIFKTFQECRRLGVIWEDTFPMRSKAGTWRWFLARSIPLFDEAQDIVQWFGTSTDITELREFQNALVESEASFRDLANSMPQLVWTADSSGKVHYYNDRAAEFDGFRREPDGSWSWQPGLHPDDLEPTVRVWTEAVAGKRLYSCEHRVRMKDGSYSWHLSRALPVFQSDGEVKAWYGTATNIHEYKLALVELAKAKESAEDANKAKSRFLANMSHEIRSPMSSVLGYADLLLERGLSEMDRMAYAASIKNSGGHLLAIIDDILDLSAVESGEFKVDRHPFALVDLITDSVTSMGVLAQRKGLELRVEFKTPVPGTIESDPLRVRQILLNLLSNAIKFTEKGRISVRLSYQDHLLSLEVEDTGLGIAEDKAERLFKAFSQVDSSISRKFGGTGLGLHLSRRLAQALGGELSLKWSRPGIGSSFILAVDAGRPQAAFVQSLRDGQRTATKGSPPAESNTGQYSVLLAEDSQDNQVLLKIFLKKLGAHVEVAVNGLEAIDLATQGHFDIILMDMMMPRMDGLEATRRLRAMGYRKPIVALTAHALKEEVEKSIAAGCDLHLTKPIQIDVLRKTIDRLLLQLRNGEASGARRL